MLVDVITESPTFDAIQALPSVSDAELITPVTINARVYGAEDPDGQIVQYKWWYFDAVEDPLSSNPMGIQITEGETAQLTIGTNGAEGEEKTYGFGLEVTDSDNQKFSKTNAPELTVTNGQFQNSTSAQQAYLWETKSHSQAHQKILTERL